MDGERLYLLGHGFTPHFRITFPDGTVRDYSQPFAPEPNDPNFTSQGAVKVLDPPGVTGDDGAQTAAGDRRDLRADRVRARRRS